MGCLRTVGGVISDLDKEHIPMPRCLLKEEFFYSFRRQTERQILQLLKSLKISSAYLWASVWINTTYQSEK